MEGGMVVQPYYKVPWHLALNRKRKVEHAGTRMINEIASCVLRAATVDHGLPNIAPCSLGGELFKKCNSCQCENW